MKLPACFDLLAKAQIKGRGIAKVGEGWIASDTKTVFHWTARDESAGLEVFETFEAFRRVHVDNQEGVSLKFSLGGLD